MNNQELDLSNLPEKITELESNRMLTYFRNKDKADIEVTGILAKAFIIGNNTLLTGDKSISDELRLTYLKEIQKKFADNLISQGTSGADDVLDDLLSNAKKAIESATKSGAVGLSIIDTVRLIIFGILTANKEIMASVKLGMKIEADGKTEATLAAALGNHSGNHTIN